jgi:3',5'-cyclic AMP phosphodiesterase CpdA
MRRLISVFLFLTLAFPLGAQQLQLPMKEGSVKLAVIGDNGTGSGGQYETAQQLLSWRKAFPFDFVIMNGDNIYGGDKPKDFARKFEEPYKALLDAGVKFHAVLGNHDDPNQRYYKPYNMGGERYYSFKPRNGVRFFALDSNYMDAKQLDWLEKELKGSGSDWKICFFHHPIYSSGKTHGPDLELRQTIEPVFFRNGVNVVFMGHEHFYERIKPQNGIYYFISGAAGQLRRGNIRSTEITAKGFDEDNHFMLVEIAGDDLYFQTISRTGRTIDSGVIHRPGAKREVTEKTNGGDAGKGTARRPSGNSAGRTLRPAPPR